MPNANNLGVYAAIDLQWRDLQPDLEFHPLQILLS